MRLHTIPGILDATYKSICLLGHRIKFILKPFSADWSWRREAGRIFPKMAPFIMLLCTRSIDISHVMCQFAVEEFLMTLTAPDVWVLSCSIGKIGILGP